MITTLKPQINVLLTHFHLVGCTLRFTQGSRMSDGRSAMSDRLEVGCLPPGEKIDISVSMRSPDKPGMYESQWRMTTSNGRLNINCCILSHKFFILIGKFSHS